MDPKTKGAWLVHHMNKLRHVTSVGDFDNIHTAGKLGVLLSGLSASDSSSLTNPQVNAIASAAGISGLELSALLQKLESRKLIGRGHHGLDVLGVTSKAVLKHTSDAFDESDPSPAEQAVVALAEKASESPLDSAHAAEYVGDTFELSGEDTADLLGQTEEIGFLDAEELDPGRKLYFNGNIFRRDAAKKVEAVLGSLSPDDHARVTRMEQLLRQNGCATMTEADTILTKDLFVKMQAIAMYDVNEVSNDTESVMYVTRPAAFGKFGDPFADDALDLAKAFVTCLKYGMTRRNSALGRITMLQRLMGKLIAGNWVGPATAIGQDYKVLELKRVVEIKHESGSMYLMRLLKREVGELALQVLTEGDASEQSLSGFPGASVLRYTSPEEKRSTTRKKQTKPSKKAAARILLSIRTGK
jgi:hypothetical protein